MMTTAKLLLHCPDKPGILAEVTDFIIRGPATAPPRPARDRRPPGPHAAGRGGPRRAEGCRRQGRRQ